MTDSAITKPSNVYTFIQNIYLKNLFPEAEVGGIFPKEFEVEISYTLDTEYQIKILSTKLLSTSNCTFWEVMKIKFSLTSSTFLNLVETYAHEDYECVSLIEDVYQF